MGLIHTVKHVSRATMCLIHTVEHVSRATMDLVHTVDSGTEEPMDSEEDGNHGNSTNQNTVGSNRLVSNVII